MAYCAIGTAGAGDRPGRGGRGRGTYYPAPPDLITGDDIHHRPNDHHNMVINLRTIGRIHTVWMYSRISDTEQSDSLHATR